MTELQPQQKPLYRVACWYLHSSCISLFCACVWMTCVYCSCCILFYSAMRHTDRWGNSLRKKKDFMTHLDHSSFPCLHQLLQNLLQRLSCSLCILDSILDSFCRGCFLPTDPLHTWHVWSSLDKLRSVNFKVQFIWAGENKLNCTEMPGNWALFKQRYTFAAMIQTNYWNLLFSVMFKYCEQTKIDSPALSHKCKVLFNKMKQSSFYYSFGYLLMWCV